MDHANCKKLESRGVGEAKLPINKFDSLSQDQESEVQLPICWNDAILLQDFKAIRC